MRTKVSDPNSIYREQLQEIGQLLQTARLSQSLSLDTMADKTLIRASLLRSIEAGDLDNLPEPVYIRGLLRRYGDSLGLDGETLASQFFAPLPVRRRSSWKESPAAQLRPLHLYAAYILVMMMAISGLSFLLKRTTPEVSALPPLDPLNQPLDSASASSSATNSSGTNQNTAPAAMESSLPDAPIEIEMTLTGQSWVRVSADGNTDFEGILQSGDSRHWTADEKLTIRAGNAGAVVVSFNNGQSETLGKPGMVKEVTYSPDKVISLVH